MEEIINEYVKICRLIGPWTDWVQGQGGNISIKDGDNLIVKASGELIGNTTSTSGWVICNIDDVKKRLYENNENIADKVILGRGKPSIETFLHTLPKKYIVHLHPSPLLNFLCSSSCNYTTKYKFIDYFKPGIQLANSLYEIYDDSISIYFMKNHGVLIAHNNIAEILEDMQYISDKLFNKNFNIITPVNKISNIWKYLYNYNNNIIIKSYARHLVCSGKKEEITFIPYTPDICVFLQEAPLLLQENMNEIDIMTTYYNKYNKIPSVIYTPTSICTVSNSIEGCNNIYEILNQYLYIDDCSQRLSDKDVDELINWDKEKERKSFASTKNN